MLEEVRRRVPKSAVVLMTAFGTPEMVEGALERGAYCVLSKPFDMHTIASRVWPFGSANSFGSPGAGGSLGFADPKAGVGYAYVTTQMGTSLTGDPRDVALREALDAALESRRLYAVPERRAS